MTFPTSILLPGLDGTGDLFAPFIAAAPARFPPQAWALPDDRARGYEELAEWVHARLPAEPVVLVAESFSGPLAVLVADRCERVAGVVLCATFVRPPLPGLLSHIPRAVWSRPPPDFLLRLFLTGGSRELSAATRRVMLRVSSEVTAARVAAVLRVDVTAELERLACPVLYLQAVGDRLVSGRSAARIRALRPTTEFARIQAPHLLLQANPDEAWTHVAAFLERIVEGQRPPGHQHRVL